MLSNFFFTSILISSLIFSAYSYNGHLLCLDHQKSLLLQLRNELIFNSSSFATKLVRWNETRDCCDWYGVDCDGAGYVVSLQLDDESISGGIGHSSSLFRLEYLEKLNLAYNKFNYSTRIPKGIHNLNYLTHLNLSFAGFAGQVPTEISSLKRLVSLDISNDYWLVHEALKLEYPNLEMLVRNLTGLRELYLDGVNITSSHERRKWSHIISSYLPNITTLSLVNCGLYGPLAKSFSQLPSLSTLRLDFNNLSAVVPDLFSNLSSLTTLRLADCGLKGFFPNEIFLIPTLQYLDLFGNYQLSGSLPPFPHNGSLKSISLSRTNFSGSIPHSINNLKTLSKLDLSSCKFTGSIPSTFANLTQLTHVDLSYNLFTGSLPSTLFEGLSNIVRLDLSGNHLEGPIHDSLFQLQSLQVLWLYGNLFSGTFQLEKIRSLPNITYLDLSDNNLRVDVSNHNSTPYGFSDLTVLDLSDNNLRVDVSNHNSTSYGFPHLIDLRLASCNLNVFPDFIKHSDDMLQLDLSNNGIGGDIPAWIWGQTQLYDLDLSRNLLTGLQKPYHIHSSIDSLDLSFNQLSGELHHLITPNITSDLQSLLLANNNLSGSIPTSLCNNAPNLKTLDLSVNKLSGNIPSCLLATTHLNVLDLGRNNFSSHIPDNFSLNCSLQYFDVNNNTLEGEIPRSLRNCKWLEMLNIGNNIINDTFPCMLSSSLRVLILRSNNFHGEVRCHNSWPNLQILDISSNHFNGSLETINFSSLKGMVQGIHSQLRRNNSQPNYYDLQISGVTFIIKGLQEELHKIWSDFSSIDLSCNNFKGKIPNEIGDLSLLHQLNLSHNALSGSIPKSFGKLGDLEALDLSQNQLTGVIPMQLAGLTFLSFLNLSYNKLVGEIPNGRQLQTFSGDSFKGNPELCGFNLNISCSSHTDVNEHEKEEEKKREIEWEYVSAALGYVVGLGSIAWLLLLCRSFRKKYFDKIDDVVQEMFDARDMRKRRRATARRRALRNQAVRRQ